MKQQFDFRLIAISIVLLFILTNNSLAQSQWNLTGNSNVHDTSYIGSNNYKDLVIKTDSLTRATITKDGDFLIDSNLVVGKTITVDSLVIRGGNLGINGNLNMPVNWIHADSLRCRIIHVGDSSMLIGGAGVSFPSVSPVF